MTVITKIQALPASPFNDTGFAGIVITSGLPSYFKVEGANLDQIISVNWFPKNPSSVLFEIRELILVNNNVGTFMIRVLDNYLDTNDRGGKISFRLDDDTTLHYPVKTYGPVSLGPLWTAPDQGLITG
jgi:hypothetical protein